MVWTGSPHTAILRAREWREGERIVVEIVLHSVRGHLFGWYYIGYISAFFESLKNDLLHLEGD